MAIDPPYRFDPWQNLVNVHWHETATGEGSGPTNTWVGYHIMIASRGSYSFVGIEASPPPNGVYSGTIPEGSFFDMGAFNTIPGENYLHPLQSDISASGSTISLHIYSDIGDHGIYTASVGDATVVFSAPWTPATCTFRNITYVAKTPDNWRWEAGAHLSS